MNKNKLIRNLRLLLLLGFVILITVASYLHIVKGGGKSPSIHALCPYGGLESLYQIFTTGSYISKIFSGTAIMFFITMVIAILFRRSFCGLICPFGAIQEFVGIIGKKFFKKKKIDKPLRYLKYIVLVMTVFYAWKTAGLWMSPYDPWSAYAHLPEGFASVWEESDIGLIILAITIVGSFVYSRFFCKYLCPMGAFYGVLGKISPFKVKRDEKACINCEKCTSVCPMNIDVQHVNNVNSAECINCYSCVISCPKTSTLDTKFNKKTVKPLTAIILVITIFFSSILVFQVIGMYKLVPEPVKADEVISYDSVKGYMTIKEAAEATKTDLKEFYERFGIPINVPENTMMKEISKISPGYSLDKAKEALK